MATSTKRDNVKVNVNKVNVKVNVNKVNVKVNVNKVNDIYSCLLYTSDAADE